MASAVANQIQVCKTVINRRTERPSMPRKRQQHATITDKKKHWQWRHMHGGGGASEHPELQLLQLLG